MMKTIYTIVGTFLVCASLVSADCYTFYEGLCPGPSNCMCTLAESCGGGSSSSGAAPSSSGGGGSSSSGFTGRLARINASSVRSASGGCSGYCRTVASGLCPGDSSCLYDMGPCGGSGSGSSSSGGPPPPPPPPPPPGTSGLGGDVCSYSASSAWSCAAQAGWSFMIVRSYCSYGAPDPNAGPTIQAAKAGGIGTTDVYHFPCAGGDPTQQVQDDVNGVGSGNFGTLWFDIETNPSPNCGWSGDTSSNCDFLQSMITAGQSLGISMGVYASSYMWSSIMGDCTAGADSGLPVWYAHYDDTRSFDDFSPFGGWSTPSMKQYNDNSAIGSGCGISADADYVA